MIYRIILGVANPALRDTLYKVMMRDSPHGVSIYAVANSAEVISLSQVMGAHLIVIASDLKLLHGNTVAQVLHERGVAASIVLIGDGPEDNGANVQIASAGAPAAIAKLLPELLVGSA